MFNILKLLFKSPRSPENPDCDVLDSDIKKIVGSRTIGNVRIQEGLFYTRKEVDEEYEKIRNVDFLEVQ